jgi:hypothetical protein
MFQRHVSRRLAALVDGEMSAREAARINSHVSACLACSAALERIRFSAALLDRLPLAEAPASIWVSIEAALAAGERARVGRSEDGFTWRPAWRQPLATWRAAAAVLLVSLTGLVLWQVTRPSAASDVVRLDARGGDARMTIGDWIETGDASRVRIRIGQIGTVDVGPNTRMQLLAARADEHRLNLAHGSISAEILAPPRLFFVETRSSTVVDLGCAYTMDVDQAGVGVLRVTSGWASLEFGGRESIVPAGASCPTRPEVGPGTPSFDDASARLKEALMAFDFAGGGAESLALVLAEARGRDTLTLWHLLPRVDAADRARVFDRLVELTPLPAGVARDKALALDPATLTLWREELAWTW